MTRQMASFGEGPATGAGTGPVLALEGLRKAGRGGAPDLGPLDLRLARGEFVTLLGPAGAGKTLAIDLAAGFLQPEGGTVLIRGERQNGLPVWRRDIGLVSALPDLFPDRTALGNAAFSLEARGVARAEREERAAAMLGRCGLPPALAQARPEALSPARQVRVALARALVHAPALLLLDDPLRALDGEDRAALADDLARLRAELGLTVLHAARDTALALSLSDRVVVLEDGRVRQVGTPRDLYDHPADPVVAALTGPCNRLPGTVLSIEDGSLLVRLDCGLEAVGLPVTSPGWTPGPGGRCTLVLRPEKVAVAPVSAAEMGEDSVPARLLEARFAGDHLRLRLAIGEGGELLAHRPAGLPLPEPGGEAAVAWSLSAAQIHAG